MKVRKITINYIQKYFLIYIVLINLNVIFSDNENTKFSGSQYQSLPSKEKLDILWEKINGNQTSYGWYSQSSIMEILFHDVKKTFSDESDVLLDGRKKLVHSVGLVGKFELIPDENSKHIVSSLKYKGIFKGCKHGLVRLSLTKKPDYSKTTASGAKDNFSPGMGIKFLRNKVLSANVLAIYAVDGQNSWNFFKNEFSNHIPPVRGFAFKALSRKFATAQPEIQAIGLKTLSEYDQDGNLESDFDIPYRLIFRPAENLSKKFKDDFELDYTQQIKSVQVNSTIYELYAIQKPESEKPVKIGDIVLRSPFITSEFGDKNLFFQHNFISYDKELHPEWDKAYLHPELYRKIHSDDEF